MDASKPLLSISCITYNHALYIRNALDGFLMQKTSFAFEILIHDDASTDGTTEIIKEYEKEYPKIIKPIFEIENQWIKGRRGSEVFNYPRAQGKYIALCEGDDYWTDPYKLQKQVDFLEQNPQFCFCCHRYKVYNSLKMNFDEKLHPLKYYSNEYFDNSVVINFDSYHNNWLTQPLTTVFLKDAWEKYSYVYKNFSLSRDVHLFYFLLKVGKGVCLNFDGGVYNQNPNGIHIGISPQRRSEVAVAIFKELYLYTKDIYFLKSYFYHIILLFRFRKIKLAFKYLSENMKFSDYMNVIKCLLIVFKKRIIKI